jgi:hypothetical protein
MLNYDIFQIHKKYVHTNLPSPATENWYSPTYSYDLHSPEYKRNYTSSAIWTSSIDFAGYGKLAKLRSGEFLNNKSIQTQRHKYAVCLWGELRAIKTVRERFYKNLVHPLNADVFVVVQKGYKDADISLLDEKIVEKITYDKPPITIYKNYDKLEKHDNYMIDSNLQIYYNFYYIHEKLGDILESNYDYVIITRSDFLHMFEFPNVASLCDESIFWMYDGHEFDGLNCGCFVCVPQMFIKKFLKCFFEYLQDDTNISKLNKMNLNIERYAKLMFAENSWRIGKMQNNAFITCDSMNEKTTWGSIKYSKKYKVFYKYIDQLNNTFNALVHYNNGERWNYINDIDRKIILSR